MKVLRQGREASHFNTPIKLLTDGTGDVPGAYTGSYAQHTQPTVLRLWFSLRTLLITTNAMISHWKESHLQLEAACCDYRTKALMFISDIHGQQLYVDDYY